MTAATIPARVLRLSAQDVQDLACALWDARDGLARRARADEYDAGDLPAIMGTLARWSELIDRLHDSRGGK